jgi:isopentenyldiphosphate isomerase
MMNDRQTPVVTRSNRGQWENQVEGHPELSQSFSSKEEAVDAGRGVADELGVDHVVEDADPTGAITDEQE